MECKNLKKMDVLGLSGQLLFIYQLGYFMVTFLVTLKYQFGCKKFLTIRQIPNFSGCQCAGVVEFRNISNLFWSFSSQKVSNLPELKRWLRNPFYSTMRRKRTRKARMNSMGACYCGNAKSTRKKEGKGNCRVLNGFWAPLGSASELSAFSRERKREVKEKSKNNKLFKLVKIILQIPTSKSTWWCRTNDWKRRKRRSKWRHSILTTTRVSRLMSAQRKCRWENFGKESFCDMLQRLHENRPWRISKCWHLDR